MVLHLQFEVAHADPQSVVLVIDGELRARGWDRQRFRVFAARAQVEVADAQVALYRDREGVAPFAPGREVELQAAQAEAFRDVAGKDIGHIQVFDVEVGVAIPRRGRQQAIKSRAHFGPADLGFEMRMQRQFAAVAIEDHGDVVERHGCAPGLAVDPDDAGVHQVDVIR